jgi:hypothetical protein
MPDERELWWQVRERLAAQAWSCDDVAWEVPALGGTVGALLASYADPGLSQRLEGARSLQHLSDDRADATVSADDVTNAWLTLRRIDAALNRPPIDLRSEVALFVGAHLLNELIDVLRAATASATVTISGPGFIATDATGDAADACIAEMSWPTFAQLCAGTLKLADSEMDLAGDDAAIDTFLAAMALTAANRQTSR